MQQGRWVSYIYRYRDNTRCENAGFIKVQRITYRTNDEARIQIGMKIYKKKPCRCKAYLIYSGDGAKYFTDIYFKAEERDSIMKRVEIPWNNPLSDGVPFEDYDGILFVCDDGEILAGMWKEYEVKPGDITPYDKWNMSENAEAVDELKRKMMTEDVGIAAELRQKKRTEDVEPAAELRQEMKLGSDEPVAELRQKKRTEDVEPVAGLRQELLSEGDEPAAELRQEVLSEGDEPAAETGHEVMTEGIESAGGGAQQSAAVELQGESAYTMEEKRGNSCLEMLRTYPKLPLFADSQFMECVKIVPQDIGKLAMSNWKLGINSFLSHGYYRYRYIMLGKVKFDKKERYVIGVPGVFTNKEKYLANMFGFSVFIPVKRTKLLTGNFGYWISEILSE